MSINVHNIFIRMWFFFKTITAGENFLKWGIASFNAPVGSERERLAFGMAINIIAREDPRVREIYPDDSPPNILKKYAFVAMEAYIHNSFAVLLRGSIGIFGKEPSSVAIQESELYIKKHNLWCELLFSRTDSQEEDATIRSLVDLGEIPYPQSVIGNYLITIK